MRLLWHKSTFIVPVGDYSSRYDNSLSVNRTSINDITSMNDIHIINVTITCTVKYNYLFVHKLKQV